MSDWTRQRWTGVPRVRGALAGAAVGGLILGAVPASPAAADGISVVATAWLIAAPTPGRT